MGVDRTETTLSMYSFYPVHAIPYVRMRIISKILLPKHHENKNYVYVKNPWNLWKHFLFPQKKICMVPSSSPLTYIATGIQWQIYKKDLNPDKPLNRKNVNFLDFSVIFGPVRPIRSISPSQ